MSITDSDSKTIKNRILQSDKPVLVDFFAHWCGPCKSMDQTIKELATNYESKIEVLKVDIDQHSDLAKSYSIQSIPTLVFFKNGQESRRSIGALSKQQLEKFVSAELEDTNIEPISKGSCCAG